MSRYVVATIKSWNINNCNKLIASNSDKEICVVTDNKKLTKEYLDKINPLYVFFPHWSWIIPPDIYKNYNCVVFHMTDLPFGRGGSPLQNLLVRGVYQTKISAIKVDGGIDTGPVYFKEPLDVSRGSADEILKRASDLVFEKMIPRFFSEDISPVEQSGEPVLFKRRNPKESEIPKGLTQRQIYDYIRMLDGEGYPPAYSRYDGGKIYYTNAEYSDEVVKATARFVED